MVLLCTAYSMQFHIQISKKRMLQRQETGSRRTQKITEDISASTLQTTFPTTTFPMRMTLIVDGEVDLYLTHLTTQFAEKAELQCSEDTYSTQFTKYAAFVQ